ncbi:MAG: C2 family cysteine protease, partial [Kangiellaceae bacterium]|nr:C2 family cysteine protease [Kangiellaceae bacterium]
SASTSGVDEETKKEGRGRGGGLVPGHAYTVIALKEAFQNKLVNIRNPWGQFEWDGDWSDNSPLWDERMKAAIQPNLDSFDGTFWMSFEDFQNYFVNVTVCRVRHYEEVRVKGSFVRHHVDNENSHVLSKWCYTLTVNEPSRVFVGVH